MVDLGMDSKGGILLENSMTKLGNDVSLRPGAMSSYSRKEPYWAAASSDQVPEADLSQDGPPPNTFILPNDKSLVWG